MNKRNLKSVGAVLAGFIAVFILSVGTDAILESTGFFPPQIMPELMSTSLLFIALLYRSAFTVIGGYITASLAPQNAMKHVIILGVVGTLVASIGVLVSLNSSAIWYPVALAVTGFPCIWLGGKLKTK